VPALAGRTIEEGNEETKIDLTYSATNGISRTGPPLGMPILRIIQVLEIANRCPVHRMLESQVQIRARLRDAEYTGQNNPAVPPTTGWGSHELFSKGALPEPAAAGTDS
jgi:hypothetical protein